MKPIYTIFIAALAACTLSWAGETNQTVFPESFKNEVGDGALALFTPLVPTYQQLFAPTTFANVWNGPVSISQIAFRVTDGASAFNSTVPHIEIHLSTSLKTPQNMSQTWQENRGVDAAIVYNHDDVSISSPGGDGINPFQVVFRLDQPFTYDPSNGSLLMYIESINGNPGASSLDAQTFSSLASSPFGSSINQKQVNAYGMITEFTWTSIPEPNAIILLFVGLCLVVKKVKNSHS
jgi:hypothetical protein